MRHHLASGRHASHAEIHKSRITTDEEHGINEGDAGQRLANIGTYGLLRIYFHFRLDQHFHEFVVIAA